MCDKSLEFHLQFWTIKVILFLNFAFYGNNFWDVITGWYIYRTVPVLSENLATFESSYLDNCKHNCFAFCLTRSYLYGRYPKTKKQINIIHTHAFYETWEATRGYNNPTNTKSNIYDLNELDEISHIFYDRFCQLFEMDYQAE